MRPAPEENRPREASGQPRLVIVNLLPTALIVLALLLALNFFGLVATPLLVITLAVLLAAALNPLVLWGQTTLRLPRPVAAILTVALLLGSLALLGRLLVPVLIAQVSSFAAGLPADAFLLGQRVDAWLNERPTLNALLGESVLDDVSSRATALVTGLIPQVVNLALSTAGTLALGVFGLVILTFTLAQPAPLVQGLLSAVPEARREWVGAVAARVMGSLSRWGRGMLLLMLAVGGANALGLWALGVDNWLLYGVIAAFGEIVPTVGPIFAALPPILATLADEPGKALGVALLALVIQQVENYVLVPFVLGGSANLHPVSVTAGVLLFGSVFGLVGAFLTVPFLILIKALYEEVLLARRRPASEADAQAIVEGASAEAHPERHGTGGG
ncbi:putative PurR-regulated permease PerM [Deinococcus budaensis]|uniref:Putative PurR-regulated permease PerM n=1 Tax=Deinococcus budaensis TaxID=1665626 RepID=A0A7W8GG44_9DEIO|nr:AI-2E family transporter [Deinococcus budaensis]MBB5234719.1 putative PurR-regulated permease PerM [Deinococcus budaensis]